MAPKVAAVVLLPGMMMDTRISKKTFKVYFVRGLMVGLLGSLCMGSFLALRGTDRIDADMSRVHMRGAEQPDYRKKVVAFVGVQVGNKGGFQ